MPNKIPMTVTGAKLLREELKRLKMLDRPQVIQAIAEARAHGDLKENAEYHAAKEQQGFIEGRIHEIETKLANAQIIDISELKIESHMSNEKRVIFGSTITLTNLDTELKVVYQIVGEDEADLKQNKISVTSPIARSVIGKYEEEEVIVMTPSGTVEYVIEAVEYL